VSQARAEALALMVVIGLLCAVLIVEYVEAIRPLPLCPSSEPCTYLLPIDKSRAIMVTGLVIGEG